MYRVISNTCKFIGCPNIKGIAYGGYCETHKDHDPGFHRKQLEKQAKKDGKKLMKITGTFEMPSNLTEKVVNLGALKYVLELKDFYNEVALEIEKNPRCWECNAWISPKDYRNATAHILPKEHFKSVATHPLCYVVAGNRCGCHQRTHRLDLFSKMKIFPIAVSRFRQIEHLIKEKHALLHEFRDYALKIAI